MTQNEKTDDQIMQLIIDTAKKQKPETEKQLIEMVRQATTIPEEKIVKALLQLEREGKISFTKKENPLPTKLETYLFSEKARWYWTTIGLAITTTIVVFTIPSTSQLVYARSALGIIFLIFLPGYALVKMLYPEKVPIKTSSENLDCIERVALSLVLSLALAPLVGLILNYTPFGIRTTPIVLSLLALTVLFATAAIIKEYPTWQTSSK
jgi:hypothetical protein